MTDGLDPRQRPPALLVGAIALALLGIAALVVGVMRMESIAASADSDDAAAVVADFDRAYREADCGLFARSTTPRFRAAAQGAVDGVFTCPAWERLAATYTIGDEYRYEQELLSSAADGDEAVVLTRERELDSGDEYAYRYTLVRADGGGWAVAELAETDGSDRTELDRTEE